jgi:biotin operon repressor
MNNRIVTTNLGEQIYQILYDLILEEYLAKRIDVSRTPIRECLCRLENEGLVEIIPRRGTFLKKYSCKKIQEIFECDPGPGTSHGGGALLYPGSDRDAGSGGRRKKNAGARGKRTRACSGFAGFH